MREQLIQYVNLLFAGAPDSDEIKLEILQNTLDRYDDLISQGKAPEAAYRLAISGIGDINEILGTMPQNTASQYTYHSPKPTKQEEQDTPVKKTMRAIAVALYILCALPLIVLGDMGMDTIGLCGTLAIVAVATVLIILGKKPEDESDTIKENVAPTNPRQELRKSVSSVIWAVGLVVYFLLSFSTGAWYITWIIFLIITCVQGLAWAIMDFKEAVKNEN